LYINSVFYINFSKTDIASAPLSNYLKVTSDCYPLYWHPVRFWSSYFPFSGVTTDRADPAVRGGGRTKGAHAQHADFLLTSNAYLLTLLFCSLSTSDASDKICSRRQLTQLTERMWSMNCGPHFRISWQPCLTVLFYCQITYVNATRYSYFVTT